MHDEVHLTFFVDECTQYEVLHTLLAHKTKAYLKKLDVES